VSTGTVNGSWAATDGVLQSETISRDLGIIVEGSGGTFDGSEIGNGALQADPLANTPYSCDGPTLMFQAGATTDVRHPVVLTPA
jgi:hypothetical protein